jgi:hypothetical protein
MRTLRKKAVIMLVTLGLGIVIFITITVSLAFLYNRFRLIIDSCRRIALIYLATGGIYRGCYQIKTQVDPTGSINYTLGGEDVLIEIDSTANPNEYTVRATANNDQASDRYGRKRVTITATVEKITDPFNTFKIKGWEQ